jgi:hypothetical protein
VVGVERMLILERDDIVTLQSKDGLLLTADLSRVPRPSSSVSASEFDNFQQCCGEAPTQLGAQVS